MPRLDPYIVKPNPKFHHDYTVILLHGRSSNAKTFASDILGLRATNETAPDLISHFPNVRWVFPEAGERWCTPFQEKRSAWFDTFSLEDLSERQDLQVDGLRDGLHHLKDILTDEMECLGGNTSNIILGGFSQGSALALWFLLTGVAVTQGKLGGFIALSAWMPFMSEAERAVQSGDESALGLARSLASGLLGILGCEACADGKTLGDNLNLLPVYIGHGTDDTLIDCANSRQISAMVRLLGSSVELQEYTGATRDGHWVKEPEQVHDIVVFLRNVMTRS